MKTTSAAAVPPKKRCWRTATNNARGGPLGHASILTTERSSAKGAAVAGEKVEDSTDLLVKLSRIFQDLAKQRFADGEAPSRESLQIAD